MAKVSIIVPFYNVEKYLGKCLETLINQTLEDIEIICINDGSTDNSAHIAEEFAKKYPKIKVFHQENSGVSAARNRGIAEATSNYIMFLDGDDLYRQNTCALALKEIIKTSSDIGVFGITEKYWVFQKPCIMNKNIKRAHLEKDIDLWKFQTYSVNKIYRKEFLTKNSLTFPLGIKTSEDLIFSVSCLLNNPQYCFIDEPLYIYRKQRKGSATTNTNGVKNDLEALLFFYNSKIFQKQNIVIQLKIVEKFCSGAWNYYKKNKLSKELRSDIRGLLDFLEEKYPAPKLEQFKKYNQLKSIFN